MNASVFLQIEGADGSHGESFSLVLQGTRRARATLEIQVVDVNDNRPQFVNVPAVVRVPEVSSRDLIADLFERVHECEQFSSPSGSSEISSACDFVHGYLPYKSPTNVKLQSAAGGFAVTKIRTRDADTGISGMARFSVDVRFSVHPASFSLTTADLGGECFNVEGM